MASWAVSCMEIAWGMKRLSETMDQSVTGRQYLSTPKAPPMAPDTAIAATERADPRRGNSFPQGIAREVVHLGRILDEQSGAGCSEGARRTAVALRIPFSP